MATGKSKDVVSDDVKAEEGAALQRLLNERNMTQQALAAASGIGTKAVISQLISGTRPMNIAGAAKMARVLQVAIDDFSPRLAAIVREAAALVKSPFTSSNGKWNLVESTTSEPIPMARVMAMETPASPYSWPFATLTIQQYAEISPEGKAELEAFARGMFTEAARRATKSNGTG